MGQSNMAGKGLIEPVDTTTHPRVYMLTDSLTWKLASTPLHIYKPGFGTGLGLTFGKLMADSNEDIIIGLIPCAKGGSPIEFWKKNVYHEFSNSYPYDEAISKTKFAMNAGTLKGILWHQGEGDSKSMKNASQYEQHFLRMIDTLKKDLNKTHLPVVVGELGEFTFKKRPYAEQINQTLVKIAEGNENIGFVSSHGLTHNGDSIHFDSKSLRKLGERYADEMMQLNVINIK